MPAALREPASKDGAPQFVTGATGCIGRHAVKALLDRAYSVACAVREPEKLSDDPLFRSPRVTLVKCDFSQPNWDVGVRDVLSACENVFHLAGEMPQRPSCGYDGSILRRVNLDIVGQLYALASRVPVKRFLYLSSTSVYGHVFEGIRDESFPYHPEDLYSELKVRAEQTLLETLHAGGARLVILRLGIVYGDSNYYSVLRKMITLVDRGLFLIVGDGNNRRALSSATLVAESLCRAAESSERLLILNVVDPQPPTIRQLAFDIASLLGVRRPWSVPSAPAYFCAFFFSLLNALGWNNHFKISDIRKATGSNLICTDRLPAFLQEMPDYYEQDLAADVASYLRASSARRLQEGSVPHILK